MQDLPVRRARRPVGSLQAQRWKGEGRRGRARTPREGIRTVGIPDSASTCSSHPRRGRLDRRAGPRRATTERTLAVKWNLRLAAAQRGVWKASELQRQLAEHGLVISAGKMSGLWSGDPASIKLDDLDVICAVLGCGVEEILIAEPELVRRATSGEAASDVVASGGAPSVTPKRRDGRSLPPA